MVPDGGEAVQVDEEGDDGALHDFWSLSAEQIEAIADAYVPEDER